MTSQSSDTKRVCLGAEELHELQEEDTSSIKEMTKEQTTASQVLPPTTLLRWWAPHQQDTKTRQTGRPGRLPASGVLTISNSSP